MKSSNNRKFQEFINEVIENWNKYLPDARITEDDLKNVQETSFRSWLLILLDKLNVDTTCFENMHQENGTRLRTSRLRLLSTVNHFLSMNNLMKLNYMNLINPDTKVVGRALQYLLNYVFFVNYFYEKTIAQCAQKVLERDQLQTEKNQLRREIENAKIEEETCAKTLRDLDKTIPQQKSTISTLQEKEERMQAEVKRIEEEIKMLDLQFTENKAQAASISENIVSEEEAESILASRQKVIEELDEQEEIIVASRHKMRENSVAIDANNALVTKMETILSRFTFDSPNMKNTKKSLETHKAQSIKLSDNIAHLDAEIASLSQSIQLKKDNIAKLNKQKDDFENSVGKEDKSNVQIQKQLLKELRQLCIKEDELLEKRDIVKEEMNLIFKVASNVLKQINADIYED